MQLVLIYFVLGFATFQGSTLLPLFVSLLFQTENQKMPTMLCISTMLTTLTVLLLISLPRFSVGCYTRIFCFGDSLTDTGNFKHIAGNDTSYLGTHPPYGETYFYRPTGRYSNGRVFADYFGEIGANDYLIPSAVYTPFREIYTFVPGVISAINFSIKELIELGAKTLVVPRLVPFGCAPFYLTMFQSRNKQDYDKKTGCIKWLNEFSNYHDKLLKKELHKLRQLYPHATILYADYYGATINIFKSPKDYGFDTPLFACCGGDGPYNFSRSVNCGDAGSRVCANPSKYVSFDGFHFTDAANKMIVHEVMKKLHKKFTECKPHSN
ncbi:hypothetical protein LUZ61_014471 [Rhynchospora tenuis]|uniref:Uncharacterized protein n=1 Tax=Rhynchospora tenuis TaxID=198213 RepID=A0AAD5WB51_9POAL|nr:hypothetical protein LUZ61_014471 [Rhynchospora tenuis]